MPDQDRDASARARRVERVLMLFRHLGTLDAPIDFEPSFKVVQRALFVNRFLLGVNRRETGGGTDERTLRVCEKIDMPHNLLAAFRQHLPHANHVYFGVEKGEQTLLFKAYLEFRDEIEQQIGGTTVQGESFLLFAGFKWDTFSPDRQATTSYTWYPSLPVSEMLTRLEMTLEADRHRGLLETVQGITEQASQRVPDRDIQYLEVTEQGNPRRSFDINIYKSGLCVEDLSSFLFKAVRHYAVPPGRFQSLYQMIKTERFGHLAGGVDRAEKDFMTVYYGAKQIHSSQLGSATVAEKPPT